MPICARAWPEEELRAAEGDGFPRHVASEGDGFAEVGRRSHSEVGR